MFVGTEEDWAVCESRESRGRGLLFTCVRVESFFFFLAVQWSQSAFCLLIRSGDGRNCQEFFFSSLATPTLLLGLNTEICAGLQQGKLFTMKDTG